jgi:hypothetical protein
VHSITVALGGRWHGDYGVAFCPAHADIRTPALSLSNGLDGRILAKCHAGCSFLVIVDALRGLGPVGRGEHRAFDRMPAAQISVAERAKTAKRAALTEKLWTNARPIAGSAAEIYLRGRGITCAVPETLRFAPSCWHLSARRYPGLIAKLEGAPAFAVHRTYLHPDGDGKADASPQKTVLGPCAGGAVRLSKDPGPLVVAEGIETALSLASGLLQETGRIADLATLNDTGDGSVNLGEAEVAAKWLTPAPLGIDLTPAPRRAQAPGDGDTARLLRSLHGRPASPAGTTATGSRRAMSGLDQIDWPAIAPAVGRILLDEPNKALSTKTHLRWGNHGSRALKLATGQFFDHEAGAGGCVTWSIEHHGAGPVSRFLDEHQFSDGTNSLNNCRAQRVVAQKTKTKTDWRKRGAVVKIWAAGVPIEGTPAETYLKSRSIDRWPSGLMR